MTDLQIEDLPAGMSYEPVKGLAVGGIVARDMANHPVIRRPSRHFATCVFDPMADNTMLSMHLAQVEPGGYKCRHRHFDETTGYVVSGSGWGEYRQSDDADLIRFDWKAGDLIVTPCNSWHQHWNASDTDYARQLSFRNSRLMKEVVHGNSQAARAEKLYDQDARFYDRFADEPDYFTQREEIAPGVIRTNFVSQVADEPLPAPDPDWGDGVAMQHYVMGGQKMIDMVLIGIRPGGHMRAHRSLSEEGIVVLAGAGRT